VGVNVPKLPKCASLDEGGFWTLVRFKQEIWILKEWVCYVMAVIADCISSRHNSGTLYQKYLGAAKSHSALLCH